MAETPDNQFGHSKDLSNWLRAFGVQGFTGQDVAPLLTPTVQVQDATDQSFPLQVPLVAIGLLAIPGGGNVGCFEIVGCPTGTWVRRLRCTGPGINFFTQLTAFANVGVSQPTPRFVIGINPETGRLQGGPGLIRTVFNAGGSNNAVPSNTWTMTTGEQLEYPIFLPPALRLVVTGPVDTPISMTAICTEVPAPGFPV